jgi:hypothetical protein
MSAVTRIKRPTYSTPRGHAGRVVHVSTRYGWIPVNPFDPTGPTRFAKFAPGVTYRREAK